MFLLILLSPVENIIDVIDVCCFSNTNYVLAELACIDFDCTVHSNACTEYTSVSCSNLQHVPMYPHTYQGGEETLFITHPQIKQISNTFNSILHIGLC